LERERVTVQEAARRLGITESAVRKRAARGQIRSVKVTEGKKERLEDEVYRQQAIILSMSQSMQALTGASESRESPETVEEEPERAEPRTAAGEAQEGAQRSWWRRIFGG
jgi:excisionase family DNA binding protein